MSDELRIRVVHLHLTSFEGISMGARHWYAELQGIRATHKLEAPMSAAEAKRLSIEGGFRYRAGDPTERFPTRQDAIEYAKRKWRRLFRGYDLLVEGDRTDLEPKPVVDGDHPLRARVNRMAETMWRERRKGDWTGCMDRLSTEWCVLTCP